MKRNKSGRRGWNSVPQSGRSLQEEMATHSSTLGLENPMDRGAWWALFGVTKSTEDNLVTEHVGSGKC